MSRRITLAARDMGRQLRRARRRGHAPQETPPNPKPATRGHCPVSRPCPFVSCRYHLALDIRPRTGSLHMPFGDAEPETLARMPATCALDVAEDGPQTLEDVAALLNLTRERVRQLEARALEAIAPGVDPGLGTDPLAELGTPRGLLAAAQDEHGRTMDRPRRIYTGGGPKPAAEPPKSAALDAVLAQMSVLMRELRVTTYGNAELEVRVRGAEPRK